MSTKCTLLVLVRSRGKLGRSASLKDWEVAFGRDNADEHAGSCSVQIAAVGGQLQCPLWRALYRVAHARVLDSLTPENVKIVFLPATRQQSRKMPARMREESGLFFVSSNMQTQNSGSVCHRTRISSPSRRHARDSQLEVLHLLGSHVYRRFVYGRGPEHDPPPRRRTAPAAAPRTSLSGVSNSVVRKPVIEGPIHLSHNERFDRCRRSGGGSRLTHGRWLVASLRFERLARTPQGLDLGL